MKHFSISNIEGFEKKIWSLAFQPLLDFPVKMVKISSYARTPVLQKELKNGISFNLPKYLLYQLSCSISDQMTSDLMLVGVEVRHTLFGAFSPTQNVTNKLRTSLGRVRYAKVSLLGVESLWGDCTFIPVDWGS